jgi:hypothetical protein
VAGRGWLRLVAGHGLGHGHGGPLAMAGHGWPLAMAGRGWPLAMAGRCWPLALAGGRPWLLLAGHGRLLLDMFGWFVAMAGSC